MRIPRPRSRKRRPRAFVADKLRAFGLEVHTGLAKTGVVGVLRNGNGAKRARSDCAPTWTRCTSSRGRASPHASKVPGKMHACGHDGHTAMLLGAAAALARARASTAPLYFIFQPAEENEGGGRVMVEEGLFERFPMRAVYGMHNWPRKPAGTFAMRAGPLMGAYDIFEIVATGKGAHAAMAYTARTRCCSSRMRSTRCRRSSRATCIRSTPAWSA